MFEGLKDLDMKKFGDVFGDLSHLKDLFDKGGVPGGAPGGAGDALKNLDLSKLFDGIKDKKGGVDKNKKDKKPKEEMIGECDGPGTTCRADGVPVCNCAAGSFCAGGGAENFKNNTDTCVLRPGQPCVFDGNSDPTCSSGKCSKIPTCTETIQKCDFGPEGSPCTNNTDCNPRDGLACNATSEVCDSCGPGKSCNPGSDPPGCCDPYRCELGFRSVNVKRRLDGRGEGEIGELIKTPRCCSDTYTAPCDDDFSCCNSKDACALTGGTDFGVGQKDRKDCCRRFGARCSSADECCPTREDGTAIDFAGSDCVKAQGGDRRCCIVQGASCTAKTAGGSGSTACCGNQLEGNSQVNCIGGDLLTGQRPTCSSCIQTGNSCIRNTECCDFLKKGDASNEGQVCVGADNEEGITITPGVCGDCRDVGETCAIRKQQGANDPKTKTLDDNDCCNNPSDIKERLQCGKVKEQTEHELQNVVNETLFELRGSSSFDFTTDNRCCVAVGGVCRNTTDCCQFVSSPDVTVKRCVGLDDSCTPDIGHCVAMPNGDIMDDLGRRLSGSGPVGVEAAPSSSLPLNALNRTNPHSSEAKLSQMKQAKEKREKKRIRTKAPWLDHLFGFSLAFSDDCSLIAVGEPGTDEQQGAVSVYRLRPPTDVQGQKTRGGEGAKALPFTFATRPARHLVTRKDPPLAGRRLSWTADPTRDRVSLQTRRLTLSLSAATPTEKSQQEPSSEVHIETVNVDLAPPRRRFSPRSRDRGGKALFGSAVTHCSVPLQQSEGESGETEYVHFLAVSAPGSWHGNVYVYVLTEGEGDTGLGGSLTGSVGDDRKTGFGYEMVQELVSQGGKGPFDFLQRLSLRDAGGFGEARMGQSVQFVKNENAETDEIVLLTTEQREGAQAYGFKMDTDRVWPPFSKMMPSEIERFGKDLEDVLAVSVASS
uniref:Uncharacterized protein n=1 Tax=Chromera velia CCMP2878 TaxID=1169474 RepID=A0A0G4HF75_9ALVE|eukprot:Cvel_6629.t1-p1 / transcript=Cvel_6629.t1 / gene=Cvel_6629 / organism=Chromera_velia_CCMP2878 / gene_product=Low-density lipoprotein receptor-related protein 2, putative / transcript_product=Low-density lipoprotein receptor-related protein 2, putative / location=Cvel_scaffold328:57868-63429(-) / protein_length=931 / sequence_SO=supercontig / SO=protein_coding / is_pseudo=false